MYSTYNLYLILKTTVILSLLTWLACHVAFKSYLLGFGNWLSNWSATRCIKNFVPCVLDNKQVVVVSSNIRSSIWIDWNPYNSFSKCPPPPGTALRMQNTSQNKIPASWTSLSFTTRYAFHLFLLLSERLSRNSRGCERAQTHSDAMSAAANYKFY